MHRALWLPILLMAGLLLPSSLIAQKAQGPEKVKTEMQSSTLKGILQDWVGKGTTLGGLQKVEADYFVVEQEGVVSMYALSAIHTIRMLKDEETGVTILEIILVSHD